MKMALLYLMSFIFVAAGITHFIKPRMYASIMPVWVPWHSAMVVISGIAEIMLGILLLIPDTRVIAAWGLILLLIAVFPANVQMAIQYSQRSSPYLWIALLRLPLQGVLISWAWQYTR